MKMTLLQMVQNILSAMDAEEVSSIGDTIESQQVAEEIKTTYYENFGNLEVANRFDIIQLEALADSTDRPNVLKIPEEVDHFEWIKYNKGTTGTPDYYDVCYLTQKEFLDYVFKNSAGSLDSVKLPGDDAVPYQVRDDKHPDYYTIFDDVYVVFDSYNSSVDSTVQNSKSVAYAEVIPSWSATDTFIPDLEAKLFPWLLSEAKSMCFINYKGVSNAKEEQRSRRQRVQHQNNRARLNPNNDLSGKNYGRK